MFDVTRFRESSAYSELEKLVIAYAEALSQTPASATDEQVAELRAHLEDGQLVELTAMIAWENFRARFNRGFDVGSQDFSEGARCAIPDPHAG